MRRYLIMAALLVALLGGFSFSASSVQAQSLSNATVINASKLNVRTAPTTAAGVIAVISRGGFYDVLGRTADSGWYLLSLPPTGIQGWASGAFLRVSNPQFVPVLNAPAPAPAGYATATVTAAALNVRAIPDPVYGAIMGRVTAGEVYIAIGRNSGPSRWYQISLPGGSIGWVSGRYVDVANASSLPITYNDGVDNPPPVQATATVTGAYYLNVRSTPNPYIPNVLAVIGRGESYPVIGRNAASTWYQLRLTTGLTGWVNGRYITVSNAYNLPITG